MNDFEVTAIGLHAEDGARVLIVKVSSVGGLEVVATIADGEIDASIRPEGEAIEVVAAEADADAVAFLKRFAFVGL